MVPLPPRVPGNSEKATASNSERTILVADRARPFQTHGFPTVLVARDDDGLDGPLVDFLQRNGFHVLEADSWAHVFDLPLGTRLLLFAHFSQWFRGDLTAIAHNI
jgi:hypothetical protein